MNEYILIYSDGNHGSYYETIKGDNIIALSSNLLGNKKTTDEGYIPLTSEDYLNSVWNNILKDTKKGWVLIDKEGKVIIASKNNKPLEKIDGKFKEFCFEDGGRYTINMETKVHAPYSIDFLIEEEQKSQDFKEKIKEYCKEKGIELSDKKISEIINAAKEFGDINPDIDFINYHSIYGNEFVDVSLICKEPIGKILDNCFLFNDNKITDKNYTEISANIIKIEGFIKDMKKPYKKAKNHIQTEDGTLVPCKKSEQIKKVLARNALAEVIYDVNQKGGNLEQLYDYIKELQNLSEIELFREDDFDKKYLLTLDIDDPILYGNFMNSNNSQEIK